MKVFKFGGAAVNNIERITNVKNILKQYKNEKLLIVISAMGKSTNALEKVTEAFVNNRKEDALQLFDQLKKQHVMTSKYLLVTHYLPCETKLDEIFNSTETLLQSAPEKSYDFYYDQIVSVGELISTTIMSYFLNEMGVENEWVDVRKIIKTDNNFRDANINWEQTQENVTSIIKPILENKTVVTQGFIGGTIDGDNTTLGREGSDYTAAVFANMLDAESQTIWKDVENVMNADPREVRDAIAIPVLNYTEVIEMAYYGAQVIHPKTIKPLQNKSIPLYVKCFLDASLPGTVIHNQSVKNLPPIIVLKKNQVMMELKSKDFSFIGEQNTGVLYGLFEQLSIRPNLTQNGAINMICVFDNREDKIKQLAAKASEIFDVQITAGLSLLTIRHYTEESIKRFTEGKNALVTQQTKQNATWLFEV